MQISEWVLCYALTQWLCGNLEIVIVIYILQNCMVNSSQKTAAYSLIYIAFSWLYLFSWFLLPDNFNLFLWWLFFYTELNLWDSWAQDGWRPHAEFQQVLQGPGTPQMVRSASGTTWGTKPACFVLDSHWCPEDGATCLVKNFLS